MNDDQQVRVATFLAGLPWKDVEGAIRDIELNLRLLLAATREPFRMWEAEADGRGFPDEFSLAEDDVRDLSDEWRLAYVARLIRSLALVYGVGEDPAVSDAEPDTPAGILHGLNDISWTPMTTEQEVP